MNASSLWRTQLFLSEVDKKPREFNETILIPTMSYLRTVSIGLEDSLKNLISEISTDYATNWNARTKSEFSKEIQNQIRIYEDFKTKSLARNNYIQKSTYSEDVDFALQQILQILTKQARPTSLFAIFRALEVWKGFTFLTQTLSSDKLADFFTKDATKNFLKKSATEVNEEILSIFNALLGDIIIRLEKHEGLAKVEDIQEGQSEWQSFENTLIECESSSNSSLYENYELCLGQVLNFTGKINYQINPSLIQKLEGSSRKLLFLLEISSLNENNSLQEISWSFQFSDAFKRTKDKINWQNFILELSRKIISYDFQSRRQSLKMSLEGYSSGEASTLVQFVGNNSFLASVAYYGTIKDLRLTPVTLSQYKQLTNIALSLAGGNGGDGQAGGRGGHGKDGADAYYNSDVFPCWKCRDISTNKTYASDSSYNCRDKDQCISIYLRRSSRYLNDDHMLSDVKQNYKYNLVYSTNGWGDCS